MKHPIYKDPKINKSRKYFLDKARKVGFTQARKDLVDQMILHGADQPRAELLGLVEAQLIGYIAEAGVAENGHVLINAENSRWNAVQSRRTLGMIKLENFQFPFKAGTIVMDEEEVSFHYDGNLMNVVRHTEDGIYALTIRPDTTINQSIEEMDTQPDNYETLFVLLSILLYMATFNTRRYVTSSLKPRCSKSNKKSVPKHVVNVVNIKQEVLLSSGAHGKGSGKTKSWIVRGHWRNQYYSSMSSDYP